MNHRITLFLALTAVAFSCAASIPPGYYGEPLSKAIAFIPNAGQVRDTQGNLRPDVKFYSEGCYPRMYMRTGTKMSFVLAQVDTSISTLDTMERLDMSLTGELVQQVDPVSYLVRDEVQNFYMPWCGVNGITDVHGFSAVEYDNVYPGIDMVFHSGSAGQKMSFVIHPGANPANLQMLFQGQDEMQLDIAGTLKMWMHGHWIYLPQAVAYQYTTNNTILPINWTANYTPNNGTGVVGFTFGTYDPTLPLVLEIGPPPMGGGPIQTPGVCWGSYFGGSNTHNIIVVSAVDDLGYLVDAGTTYASFTSFPGNGFGIQYFFGSPTMCITRFKPTWEAQWTDFLGGSFYSSYPEAIALDGHSYIYMVGSCDAYDLHTVAPNGEYLDTTGGPSSGFIARFKPADGILNWYTYFNLCYGVAVDGNHQLVVVGDAWGNNLVQPPNQPPNSTHYPNNTTNSNDGFVVKFDNQEHPWWSCYLGGSALDDARCVAIGPNNSIYVCVNSYSTDINLVGGGLPHVGGADIYLARFTSGGSQTWGNYYGGSLEELQLGRNLLDVAPNGDIFIAGQTNSPDLPYVPGANWSQPWASAGLNGFIAQYSGATMQLVYSTDLQGNAVPYTAIQPSSIVVDDNGQLFVAGLIQDPSFLFQAYPGIYSTGTLMGSTDGFILWLDANKVPLWSTRYGGEETDYDDAISSIAYDAAGSILYAVGITRADYSAGQFFPLTNPGLPAVFRSNAYPPDSYVAAFCIYPITTSIASPSGTAPFGLFNSATGAWSFTGLPAGNYRSILYDAIGRMVRTATVQSTGTEDRIPVETSGLASGQYVLSLGDRHLSLIIP